MRFTATLAGIAAVASALKIQESETNLSGSHYLDANVTVHVDLEFSDGEPAEEVAVYKEWVWCKNPEQNTETW